MPMKMLKSEIISLEGINQKTACL
nr:unnamed protein product [Callosobruchus analis]